MERRGPPRRRLAVKRETLRRLDVLSPDALRRVAGGTELEVTLFGTVTETCAKYAPDRLGRTNSKHCLSGDD